MQRIIDIEYVDQALEIQKKYNRFCGMCNCWFDIHGINEDWYEDGEPKKTRLEAFCEDINRNLDDDD